MLRAIRAQRALHQHDLLNTKRLGVQWTVQLNALCRLLESAQRQMRAKPISGVPPRRTSEARDQSSLNFKKFRGSIRLGGNQPGLSALPQGDQSLHRKIERADPGRRALHRFDRRIELLRRRIADEVQRHVHLFGRNGSMFGQIVRFK